MVKVKVLYPFITPPSWTIFELKHAMLTKQFTPAAFKALKPLEIDLIHDPTTLNDTQMAGEAISVNKSVVQVINNKFLRQLQNGTLAPSALSTVLLPQIVNMVHNVTSFTDFQEYMTRIMKEWNLNKLSALYSAVIDTFNNIRKGFSSSEPLEIALVPCNCVAVPFYVTENKNISKKKRGPSYYADMVVKHMMA